MKKLWFSFLVGLLFFNIVFGAEVKKHIRVDLSGQSEAIIIDFMRLHPDITSYGRKGQYVDAVATVTELEAMERLGISVEVLIEVLFAVRGNRGI